MAETSGDGGRASTTGGSGFLPDCIAVIVPAYRTADTIGKVLAAIPSEVRHVVVVDDASPDSLRDVLVGVEDARVVVIRHAENRGVGGAMKTGFAKALELGADVIVKIDSDGQMDPALLPRFVEPLRSGRADFAKGNRFADLSVVRRMPLLRRAGNLSLSFLVKAASGYWSLFDPCNGYLALRSDLVRALRPEQLADRYFFEISLLCEAYFARAVVVDVPMHPKYDDEVSSLSPGRSLVEFSGRLVGRTLRRIGSAYFLRDFNVVSVLLTAGVPLTLFGAVWSLVHWYRSWATGLVATTGTVMIGTLAIILGFQLLLQAIVLDVQNEPGRAGR
jgi:glycosyltransferase involved in cell wall biosynthesis